MFNTNNNGGKGALVSSSNQMIRGSSTELSDRERAAANRVYALIDVFLALRPDMPASHIRTFLLVALNEGHSVLWYTNKAGVANSVMTRQLFDIGEFTRHREPGLGLVERRVNPEDMREHQLFLTPKGRALFHRAIRIVESAA